MVWPNKGLCIIPCAVCLARFIFYGVAQKGTLRTVFCGSLFLLSWFHSLSSKYFSAPKTISCSFQRVFSACLRTVQSFHLLLFARWWFEEQLTAQLFLVFVFARRWLSMEMIQEKLSERLFRVLIFPRRLLSPIMIEEIRTSRLFVIVFAQQLLPAPCWYFLRNAVWCRSLLTGHKVQTNAYQEILTSQANILSAAGYRWWASLCCVLFLQCQAFWVSGQLVDLFVLSLMLEWLHIWKALPEWPFLKKRQKSVQN